MARPNLGTVLDQFTRADGAPGANWVNEPFNDAPSAFSIVSNQLLSTSHSDMYWASSFTQNGTVGVGATVVGTLPSKQAAGNFNGFYLEIIQQPSSSSNTCDGYQVGLRRRSGGTGKDTITIWKYTNAATAATLLAETDLATDLVANDTWDLTVDTAGNIKVYRNGTQIASVQDTASPVYFPNAATGIFMGISMVHGSSNLGGFDDFYAGQVAAGTTSVAKTLTPSYNVKVQLVKNLSPSYNVIKQIVQTLAPSYLVKRNPSKQLQVAYSVIQRIPKTLTASYQIASAPVNTVLPVISGTPVPGNVLSTTTGTWTNSPTGYTYQWQVETAPGSGVYVDIPGETANTLQI